MRDHSASIPLVEARLVGPSISVLPAYSAPKVPPPRLKGPPPMRSDSGKAVVASAVFAPPIVVSANTLTIPGDASSLPLLSKPLLTKPPPPPHPTESLPCPPLPPSTVEVSSSSGNVRRLAPIAEVNSTGTVWSDVEEVSTADMTHITAEDYASLSFERLAEWESAYRPVTPLHTADAVVFGFSESSSIVMVNHLTLQFGRVRLYCLNTLIMVSKNFTILTLYFSGF